MTHELHHADCMDFLPTLADGSIDAIITDLPYGTTACSWDTIIPFAPMWAQVKRVLKQRGVFVTTASQPFTSALVMSNPDWFRDEWVWEKDRATRFLDANKRPLKAHENILVFCQELPEYNPQKTKGHNPASKHGRGTKQAGLYRNDYKILQNYGQEDRYPRSVILFNVPNHGDFGEHPTQKPVALYEYLIRTYTNPGETVLDFTMGSGTTGVAAIRTGRNFIGCEKDAGYFEIAQGRCAEASLQPALFHLDAAPKEEQAALL